MRYKNFTIRLCNFLLILLLLGAYQTVIHIRAQEEEMTEMQSKINQLEGELAQAQQAGESAGQMTGEEAGEETDNSGASAEKTAGGKTYADGTYQGEAEGFGGPITVEVAVSGGEISSVEIISADKEDSAYLAMAKDVISEIVERQSTEVDAVSGATYSSEGIKGAVKDALSKAVQ